MPTSSRARLLASDQAHSEETRAFVYRSARPAIHQNGQVPGELDLARESPAAPSPASFHPLQGSVFEEEAQAREQRAYERGVREGAAQAQAEYSRALAAERTSIIQAIEQFATDRQQYFHRVEPEIVRLALNIARKILHREAQIDPLLLAGVVRVALDKVATGSAVRLRVPEGEVSKWLELIATRGLSDPLPEVVADPSLGPAQCLLETEVGTADVSLETQLEEIEKGFLDILALRPGLQGSAE